MLPCGIKGCFIDVSVKCSICWGSNFFDFGGSNNIFNLCSNIELNTQNPNPIFKITIRFTETPKTPKYFWIFGPFSRIEKFRILFCIIYKLHNAYFVLFVIFVNFVILVFLDFYIDLRSSNFDAEAHSFDLPAPMLKPTLSISDLLGSMMISDTTFDAKAELRALTNPIANTCLIAKERLSFWHFSDPRSWTWLISQGTRVKLPG